MSAAPNPGIRIHWVNNTPTPGLLGEVVISSFYPDFSPKTVEIYINKNFNANNNVMLREMERALIFQSDALDPQMIMYYGAATPGQLHPGEGEEERGHIDFSTYLRIWLRMILRLLL